MDLIPSETQVAEVLERTGALRHGHFRHPNGLHADLYLQIPLVMRHYADSRMLSVALSRKIRQHDTVRRELPEVSVVAPAVGGLPVAFGVAEALRASQTYWAEMEMNGRLELRQFLAVQPGEKIILVDDILRTGNKLSQLRALVEAAGAQVLALAVLVAQPFPDCARFDGLPVVSLLTLPPHQWPQNDCPQCRRQTPLVEVRI